MSAPTLYLASASPRRIELLRGLGICPVARPQSVDETIRPGEPAEPMVRRLAEAKARAALAGLDPAHEALVLGADTAVLVDDRLLGKPSDTDEAVAMLRLLRGRPHQVLTGVSILRSPGGPSVSDVERTTVRFRDYDEVLIRAYARSGEPLDKAGAYGIQGLGVLLVDGIDGSWSNVVGLPLERLPGWLERVGVKLGSVVPGLDETP